MKLSSRITAKLYAARHKGYVRALSGLAPYYLVNEFPKSGGTWLAQMLADALGLPFRRNQPIRFERSVTHGHFLSPVGLRHVVILWRDPRDVLVSFYYHCYFVNEYNNALLVDLMKQRLPFENYHDIRNNLPAFIEFVTKTPISPGFSWPVFARVWANRQDTVQASYEGLRADTPGELTRIAMELTGITIPNATAVRVAEKYSFSNVKAQAKNAGTEDSAVPFVREGSLGGWRRHFLDEARDMVATYYGESMRQVGYLS